MPEKGRMPRRTFLTLGLALTLFGCLLAAIAIILPAWQIVKLDEFNAIHEHGVFYDCVRSDTIALKSLFHRRNANLNYYEENTIGAPTPAAGARSRICTSKMETGAESVTWTMRMAVEEGDPAARELLLHRFLPQHKAVVFFFVFSLIFALISLAVGACSECFVPNGVLHVLSLSLAMGCSLLGDIIFIVAAGRDNSRHVHGFNNHVYEQHVGWAFYVHAVGSAALCAATLCALIAVYLLVCREYHAEKSYSQNILKKYRFRSVPYVCTAFVNTEKMTLPNLYRGGVLRAATYTCLAARRAVSADISADVVPSWCSSTNAAGGTFSFSTVEPSSLLMPPRQNKRSSCVTSVDTACLWQSHSGQTTAGSGMMLSLPPPPQLASTSALQQQQQNHQQLRMPTKDAGSSVQTTVDSMTADMIEEHASQIVIGKV